MTAVLLTELRYNQEVDSKESMDRTCMMAADIALDESKEIPRGLLKRYSTCRHELYVLLGN